MIILVSACLLGDNVRYDGGNKADDFIISLKSSHTLIPICPETFGGLKSPRLPSEIVGNRVLRKDGVDLTDEFHKGALKALEILDKSHADFAILKSKSPSCGYNGIYDGSFKGNTRNGNGIFADMLIQRGLMIFTENDRESVIEYINRSENQ